MIMGDWIDINVEKPQENEWVLIHHTFHRVNRITIAFMHSTGDFETEDDSVKKELVTHWMPLPKPPSVK